VHVLARVRNVLSQQLRRQQRALRGAVRRQLQPQRERQPLLLLVRAAGRVGAGSALLCAAAAVLLPVRLQQA
jgi:hypothetical protein